MSAMWLPACVHELASTDRSRCKAAISGRAAHTSLEIESIDLAKRGLGSQCPHLSVKSIGKLRYPS